MSQPDTADILDICTSKTALLAAIFPKQKERITALPDQVFEGLYLLIKEIDEGLRAASAQDTSRGDSDPDRFIDNVLIKLKQRRMERQGGIG